jgi:CBS domain
LHLVAVLGRSCGITYCRLRFDLRFFFGRLRLDLSIKKSSSFFPSLPVTENDKLVGMITDRDIAIRGVAEGKGPDAKVRDAMSPEVKYCFEDEDVAHVAENMAELQVRRLPVMNHDKRLVGIVSLAESCDRRFTAENSKGASRHFATGRPTQPESAEYLTTTWFWGGHFAPSRCRDQLPKRSVMKAHGITLSFHREMADSSGELGGPDITAAATLERYPRFIKGGFQNYESLGIKRSAADSKHVPSPRSRLPGTTPFAVSPRK